MEEFIQEYREESYSIIERVQHNLLSVDLRSDNKELVEDMYRSIHTLKGSSRMFGFEQVEALTHDLENKLDQIREGYLILDKTIIDLCLKVLDTVTLIIEGKEDQNLTRSVIEEVQAYCQEDNTRPSTYYQIFYTPDKDIYARGINPESILDEIQDHGDATVFTLFAEDTFENMRAKKRISAAFEILLSTSEERDIIEDIFLFLEKSEYKIYEINSDDEVEVVAERAKAFLPKGKRFTKKQKEERKAWLDSLEKIQVSEDIVVEEVNESTKTTQNNPTVSTESSSLNYINVRINRLDEMIRLVSELVTLKAKFNYQANVLNDSTLSDDVDLLEKLSNRFRDIAFNMRLVPLQVLSLKFQRSIRELGDSLGKEVNFITQGLDTEFDKSIINEIEGPLMHIIRNAIDHGLELPDEREKLGKPRQGLLKISAFYEGANVFIQVQDDGKGLDLARIKNSAIERGLMRANDNLTEQEITNLIFQSGFSTQKQATKLSGRGVGMDVVINKLKELRGSINITTEKGLGTTFTLRLPLSLSILDVLHVKVGDVNYLIPQNEIEQCFSERLNGNQIVRSGLNMKFNNQLIPHLQLDEILSEKNLSEEEPSIILINKNDEMISLEVHEIIGEDQLVIKPVDDALSNLSYLAGIAVLGNGELAFLLDSFRLKNSLTENAIHESSKINQ